ncbi:MAG: hypothetical protein RR288_01030 [Oscillibacter sp.]
MKLFLTNKKQLGMGAIVSGVGLLLYLIGSALALPQTVLGIVAIAFALAAVYTMASIVFYPKARRKAELSYNILWGQAALTILLVACAYLHLREWL